MGRKHVGMKTSMSTETQKEYTERVEHRRQRRLLCGGHRRFPRPEQKYVPITGLFGTQDLGKFFINHMIGSIYFMSPHFLIIFLGIKYTCPETIHLTERRWRLLSTVTFSLFSTGAILEERPEGQFDGQVLTLEFETKEKFLNYTRRALFTEGTRLVDFKVSSKTPTCVICTSTFNLTPKLRIRGEPLDPTDDLNDPDTVVIHM